MKDEHTPPMITTTIDELRNALNLCSIFAFSTDNTTGEQYQPTSPHYCIIEQLAPFFTRSIDSIDDLDSAYEFICNGERDRLKTLINKNDAEQRALHPILSFLRKKTAEPAVFSIDRATFKKEYITYEKFPPDFKVQSRTPIPTPMTKVYFSYIKNSQYGPVITLEQDVIVGAWLSYSKDTKLALLRYESKLGYEIDLRVSNGGGLPIDDDTFIGEVKGRDSYSDVVFASLTQESALLMVRQWVEGAKIRISVDDDPFLSRLGVSVSERTIDELSESRMLINSDDHLFASRCEAVLNTPLSALVGECKTNLPNEGTQE